MPESELPWLVPGLRVYYHCSTGLLALVQEVGIASLFGINWEVKRCCTSMPQRSGWSLPLQLLLYQAVPKAPSPPNSRADSVVGEADKKQDMNVEE